MKIDPALIGDICVGSSSNFFPTTTLKSLIDETFCFPVGTVLPPKAPYDARAAALAAGIPDTVPLQIINRYVSTISWFTYQRLSDVIRRCQQILLLWIDGRSEHLEPDQEW